MSRSAAPQSVAVGGRSLREIVPVLLIAALALVAYVPAFSGGYLWDDADYVTDNVNLRSLAGLRNIWLQPRLSPQYYPLTFTTFWLEYQLWGATAAGYHAVNVCLHALNTVLVWLVLRRLRVAGALLAA